ncbi:Imm26 family immunity protein [Lunatimonas salinarum]|uniref:Imm26 family immunity protein n=1 Tax=Lunatimonas salinarum TaxID=1774590 RepID=UPI001AE04C51|nr:Imm26 family immunity protein [Lunatimonas salinarum]
MAKRLKHGDIIQIPLPKNLGFAYGRYLDLEELFPPPEPPRLSDLIKIFNYKTPTNEYNLKEMESSGYLMQSLLVSGLPPTIKKGIWHILDEKAFSEDNRIPHFSRHEDWISDDINENWYYCIDANSQKKVKSTYEDVKHLSRLAADGTGIIELKIAMTFLIQEGKRIEDYFDLDEYYEKATFEAVKATPPYYLLPKEIRDKALNSQ